MALSEPVPADPQYKRYAPSRPFPAYRFVPGLNPHPVSDPRGHSFRGGAHEPPPKRFPPERWRENQEYLLGCDYYNFAYFWEAHEAWEGLWHLTDKAGAEGLFLQGLIQITASNLKRHMRESTGTVKLANLGIAKLRTVLPSADDGTYMGLDVPGFIQGCDKYLLHAEAESAFPLIRLDF
ncbi:MAG: DUF309 domain-containing protein [Planctomycetes bacterium]|nr:DUF309 domain-containing protein [Planctomycetota bacterium]